MNINIVSGAELEETVFALGYELIQKQQRGSSLSATEMSFINYIYTKVDKQISLILQDIDI